MPTRTSTRHNTAVHGALGLAPLAIAAAFGSSGNGFGEQFGKLRAGTKIRDEELGARVFDEFLDCQRAAHDEAEPALRIGGLRDIETVQGKRLGIQRRILESKRSLAMNLAGAPIIAETRAGGLSRTSSSWPACPAPAAAGSSKPSAASAKTAAAESCSATALSTETRGVRALLHAAGSAKAVESGEGESHIRAGVGLSALSHAGAQTAGYQK